MDDFRQSDWNAAEKLIEDLRVDVDYRRTRSFGVGRFTDKPICDLQYAEKSK